jgi:hypothetical protein
LLCYGNFDGSATFGSITITSSGSSDIFVAKLNTSGNWEWASSAGGVGTEISGTGNSISIDLYGNSYITGQTNSVAHFGTHTIVTNGLDDVFIAKCDPNGNFKWVHSGGGNKNDNGIGIVTNSIGESYMTGTFRDTISLNSTTLYLKTDDIFVAKYDSLGIFQWIKTIGGNQSDQGRNISMDKENNIYILGRISISFLSDSCFLDNLIITGNYGYYAFLGKISDPILINSISISSVSDNQLFVYPNPASNSITINFYENASTIEMYTITGQCISVEKNVHFPFIKDLSFLTEGIYYLKVIGKNNFSIKKIVISK